MKKTLVALAVLAASGASFAQVTITGQVSMGLKGTHDNAGNDASGLGVDTSNLYFTATEDLGGGQKIVAKQGFDTMQRGTVTGGDTVLTYTNNSFGQIELGAVKGDDVFTSIAYGGANLITFDGKLNQLETSSDYVSYAAPIGPLFFKFKHSESGNSSSSSGGLGLGVGTQGASGSAVGQATNDFVLAYLKGPLQVVGAYRAYTNQDEQGGIQNGNGLTKKSVVHFEAGYDFGVAKLGFGYDHADVNWGVTQDNAIIGFSVPAGAWTFGAAWESSKVNGAVDAPLAAYGGGITSAVPAVITATQTARKNAISVVDGTASGVTMGAQYNFSKSTNIALRYAAWTLSGYEQLEQNNFGYKQTMTQTDLLLNKTF